MAAFNLLRILTCLLMAIIIATSFANGQEALAPPPPSTEPTDSSQSLLGQTPQGTRRGILFNDPTFDFICELAECDILFEIFGFPEYVDFHTYQPGG